MGAILGGEAQPTSPQSSSPSSQSEPNNQQTDSGSSGKLDKADSQIQSGTGSGTGGGRGKRNRNSSNRANGANRVAAHTKSTRRPFSVKAVLFRRTAFPSDDTITKWVNDHYHHPPIKIVKPPTGVYTHAIVSTNPKFTIFRNKKINRNITLLLAK